MPVQTQTSISCALLRLESYLHFARHWAEIGADIIGGCCGISPDHISLLAKELKDLPPINTPNLAKAQPKHRTCLEPRLAAAPFPVGGDSYVLAKGTEIMNSR